MKALGRLKIVRLVIASMVALLPIEAGAQQFTNKQVTDASIMSEQKSLWLLECLQMYTPKAIKAGMTTVDFKAVLVGSCIKEKSQFKLAFADWSSKAYPSVGLDVIFQTFEESVSHFIDVEVTKLAMAKLQ